MERDTLDGGRPSSNSDTVKGPRSAVQSDDSDTQRLQGNRQAMRGDRTHQPAKTPRPRYSSRAS